MKALCLLLGIILVAPAAAEPLRLILAPQQVVVSRGAASTKFDLFLYNGGKSAATVPSLEQFRAFYTVYRRAASEEKPGTELRAFSQPIKDHTLKAQRFDHTVIEIDLSGEDGDYIELRVEIGHDERVLTSNSVLMRWLPDNAPAANPASSPKAAITPER